MFEPGQAIRSPFGITVFGSAISRIAPDFATIRVSVGRVESKPANAFAEARKGSWKVQEFIQKAGIKDFGTSRLGLSEERRFLQGEQKFLGYAARVSFHVNLFDLDRVEDILTGLVDAGANEVDEMTFGSSRLKELRADTRRRAVAAAREKAVVYGEAAGVGVGQVLHIEDVNPSALRGSEGHVRVEPRIDDEGEAGAFDPGSITVGAAVLVAYELVRGAG